MNSFKPAVILLIIFAVSLSFVACGKGTPPPNIQPLTVATRSLPVGITAKAYNTSLAANGGVGPYNWTITSGSLPDGLTMSNSGVISGTPTKKGVSSVTVQVTDSQTPTAAVASAGLNLTVNDPLSITTKTLKTGAVNVPYAAGLTASGGAPPYTWSLVSGSLPAGLSLVPSGGITGTPTAEGTANFTLQAADAENPPATATQAYSLTIGGADARLSGNYVFLLRGFKNGNLVLQAGSFVSDGAGNITSGVVDTASNNGGSGNNHVMASITGSYALDDTGHGTMTLFFSAGSGSASYQIASAVSAPPGYFSFIQNGDGNTTGAGAGLIKTQATIPTDLSSFGSANGDPWVFGGYGVDVANARYAAAGTFKLSFSAGNTSATISQGLMDSNDNGTVKTANTFSGSMTAPDATTGRGTISFGFGQSTGSLAYYYVGSSNGSIELVTIDTDPVTAASPAILYTFRKQNSLQGGYTNAAVEGAVLSELSAVPSPSAPDVSLGLLDFDGKGTAYATIDDNSGGTVNQNKFTANYTVDSTGRMTFTGWGGSANPVMYLWSFESGFVMGQDPAVTYGEIEFQNVQTNTHNPANADFTGAYSGGSLAPVLPSQTVEVDTDNADGAGNLTGTYDISGGGNPPQQGLNLKATYNVDTSCPAIGTFGYTTCGRFPLLDSNNNQIGIGYLVDIFTKNRVVILKTNTQQPVLNAIQK
jgi:hypothetical protein